jgi:threonine synthase
MARRAIQESDGFSITVSDAEILEAQAMLARTTGIFAEPAAAAGAAGLKKAAGIFGADDRVVLLVTGHGLKDVDAPLSQITVPAPINPSPGSLPE